MLLFNSVAIWNRPRDHHSFVALHNNHTYRIDVLFLGKDCFSTKQQIRAGLVSIDVLSMLLLLQWRQKKVQSCNEYHWARNQQFYMYMYRWPGRGGNDLKQYIEDQGIILFIELQGILLLRNMIKTFKDKLFKRLEADKKTVKKTYSGQIIQLK